MSDNNAQSAITSFEQAMYTALVRSTDNVTRAANYQHGLFNIDLSFTPSITELKQMYQTRHHHFQSISSLEIPYQEHNGTKCKVPVTPIYQAVENQTFHTVTISRTDGATMVVLIRESDNYVVGIRVFLTKNEALNAPWFIFKGIELPSRFRNVVEMHYGYSYEIIEDLKFGKNTLSDLLEFLINLRMNPKQDTTENGKLLLGSLFLLFGEAQRFRAARNWILLTSESSSPKNIPKNIADIFRKWSDISKICFELFLALQDNEIFGSNISRNSLRGALLSWKTTEVKFAHTVLKFRDLQNNIHLNCLVGGEVLLLKHDFDWCTRIVMRLSGYFGDLNVKRYNIKRRFGRNFGKQLE